MSPPISNNVGITPPISNNVGITPPSSNNVGNSVRLGEKQKLVLYGSIIIFMLCFLSVVSPFFKIKRRKSI